MTTATPDTKRRALGKGLDSLLPRIPSSSAAAPAPAPVESEGGKPREISVEDIDRNPFQTRMRMDEEQLAELAASITSNGVVQPILVRPQANGRFQLIAGERRWQASKLATVGELASGRSDRTHARRGRSGREADRARRTHGGPSRGRGRNAVGQLGRQLPADACRYR